MKKLIFFLNFLLISIVCAKLSKMVEGKLILFNEKNIVLITEKGDKKTINRKYVPLVIQKDLNSYLNKTLILPDRED